MANKKKAPNVKDNKTPASVNKPPVNVSKIIPPLPLVSVVVPMYNSARYIKSCLVSVLNQTLKNLEVICVDDASTDDTVKIVSELAAKDRRIKLCKHGRNSGGPSEPRNTGIRLSRGKYIAFLDSDDMYMKSALEELVSVAEKWRADVVHTEKVYVPENNAVDVKNGIKLIPFSRESGGFCEKHDDHNAEAGDRNRGYRGGKPDGKIRRDPAGTESILRADDRKQRIRLLCPCPG